MFSHTGGNWIVRPPPSLADLEIVLRGWTGCTSNAEQIEAFSSVMQRGLCTESTLFVFPLPFCSIETEVHQSLLLKQSHTTARQLAVSVCAGSRLWSAERLLAAVIELTSKQNHCGFVIWDL